MIKKSFCYAFFSIFGGGAQHAAKNRKKIQNFRFAFFSIFGDGAQHAAKNRKKCFRFAFDRNGGAPPGRGRRRTGPHRFDQMLERTAEQTNERKKVFNQCLGLFGNEVTAPSLQNFSKCLLTTSNQIFKNDRLWRCDQFCPIFVKIGAILAIFRPFEVFGHFSFVRSFVRSFVCSAVRSSI